MTPDDREIEEILRNAVDRLAPRDGAFETITKRARRRKAGKALLAAAAVVVVAAGAVPAVIAVRNSSSDQSITIANETNPPLPHTNSSIAPPTAQTPVPGLVGYFPLSVTFIAQNEGFLWGTVQGARPGAIAPEGVVAHTTDGGASWTAVGGPPVSATTEPQIRFASPQVGFVFGGAHPYVTTDGGASWRPYQVPGHLSELEAMQQKVWALVRPTPRSDTVRLYTATVADPALKPVRQVPPMTGLRGGSDGATGAAAIALSDASVHVLVGDTGFWTSPNGKRWRPGTNPCPRTLNHAQAAPTSTVIAAGSSTSLVAACGYGASDGVQTKLVFESGNAGKSWGTPSTPPTGGYLETITAGSGTIIIGNSRGGAVLTRNNGADWQAAPADQVDLSFVGFIDVAHVVAVADRADEEVGAFASSTDGARTWKVLSFPCNATCPH